MTPPYAPPRGGRARTCEDVDQAAGEAAAEDVDEPEAAPYSGVYGPTAHGTERWGLVGTGRDWREPAGARGHRRHGHRRHGRRVTP